MAGQPILSHAGFRTQSASATTITPSKPSANYGGAMMLALCTVHSNAVISTATSGWTKISQVNSGAGFTAALFIAPFSAAAPVFTWSGAAACSAAVCSFAGGDADASGVAIGAIGSNSGTGATHTSPSIVMAKNNSLVVLVDAVAAATTLANPSGWFEFADGGSVTDGGNRTFDYLIASPLGAGNASPAVSVAGGNAAWVQWQVEIILTEPTRLESTKIEAPMWLDAPDGLASHKVEAPMWLDPPAGLASQKVEVLMWLDLAVTLTRRRQMTN